MTITPLVSIAIPFYNSEKYLRYAILSVCNQTYKNWELLLLDDGSTDDSLRIAQSYAGQKIKVYSDGCNKGLIYRLNQSIQFASGQYYARMDADDIMHIDRIATQMMFLSQNTDVDVLGTAWYSIDSLNNVKSMKIPASYPTVNTILQDICFLHPSILGKKEWFIANKYDSQYTRIEDYELWLRTINRSCFVNLSLPLMYYREFGVSHWRKYVKTQIGAMRLYRNYKCYSLSKLLAIKLYVKSLLKIQIYSLACFFNVADLLVKLRTKKTFKFDYNKACIDLVTSITANLHNENLSSNNS